ncbi:glycerophosphoryl diester phosphodiesterase [Olivibacter sp. CPCC 100613]|uniref:glycerophosphoryl diester phosphodiesterase n=1 Tax=Olivibacter sp. CPCC 100613 TaxID=3079931 RepID=UPI002FFA459F
MKYRLFVCISSLFISLVGFAQSDVDLENKHLKLQWKETAQGYRLNQLILKGEQSMKSVPKPLGEYTILFSKNIPDTNNVSERAYQMDLLKAYPHNLKMWKEALLPVPLNTAGKSFSFFPKEVDERDGELHFKQNIDVLSLESRWQLDDHYPGDILVEIRVTAKEAGYYAIASPTLYPVEENQLKWAILPGYFQGRKLEPNLMLAYGYGQGIPAQPVVVRERVASTLAPIVQHQNGLSLAVIPAPGTGRDPWESTTITQQQWKLGLSLMDRKGQLSPTLYHPVLGQEGSYMQPGEQRVFHFRYVLNAVNWFDLYKHAVYDIYRFKDFLGLKTTKESLTHRISAMVDYLKNDSTSLWDVYDYQGLKIGAQAYLGPIAGSDHDAVKNSDYGAMWMTAKLSADSVLQKERLPYARNFKLVQQQKDPGFFQGAAIGQYYLWKGKQFTEEWGNYVEPIALTYYTMIDLGNILLYEPQDSALLKRLRVGGDKLLSWQKADGRWEVAYDRKTTHPVFKELTDRRPTFYGLVVAYRLLGDKRYLDGAEKGAKWLMQEAVNRGSFLGVCGDVRFAPDFATGQTAQAFLDLYDITKKETYLKAAIETARLYTTSIYTHPIPSTIKKHVGEIEWQDWQISQVGLSFEHGGIFGSANVSGPILLASHAGMFVRMFDLTKDSIFIDMARAAAWGRDAFIDPASHVASYYWSTMNAGPGPFPHHAWWQIGWIMDYLLSEASLRTNHLINFPRGFLTPKVGPHQPYGFAPGKLFNDEVELDFPKNRIFLDNEKIDFFCAKGLTKNSYYIVLMNNSVTEQNAHLTINHFDEFNRKKSIENAVLLDQRGAVLLARAPIEKKVSIRIPACGLRVIKFD